MHIEAIIAAALSLVLGAATLARASGDGAAPNEADTHPHARYEEALRTAHQRTNAGGALFAGAGSYTSTLHEWQVLALGFADTPPDRRFYVAQRTTGAAGRKTEVEWADARTCPALATSIDELPLIVPPRIALPVMDPKDFTGLNADGPAVDGTSVRVWSLGWPGVEFGGTAAEEWLGKFTRTTSACWSKTPPAR